MDSLTELLLFCTLLICQTKFSSSLWRQLFFGDKWQSGMLLTGRFYQRTQSVTLCLCVTNHSLHGAIGISPQLCSRQPIFLINKVKQKIDHHHHPHQQQQAPLLKHLLGAGCCVKLFAHLNSLIPAALQGGDCYHAYFSDGDTKARKGQ